MFFSVVAFTSCALTYHEVFGPIERSGIGSGSGSDSGSAINSGSGSNASTVNLLPDGDFCRDGLNELIASNVTNDACVGLCAAMEDRCSFVYNSGSHCTIANDANLTCYRISGVGNADAHAHGDDSAITWFLVIFLPLLAVAAIVSVMYSVDYMPVSRGVSRHGEKFIRV